MRSFQVRWDIGYHCKNAPRGVLFAVIFFIHAHQPAGGFSCIDIQYPSAPGTIAQGVDLAGHGFEGTTPFVSLPVQPLDPSPAEIFHVDGPADYRSAPPVQRVELEQDIGLRINRLKGEILADEHIVVDAQIA